MTKWKVNLNSGQSDLKQVLIFKWDGIKRPQCWYVGLGLFPVTKALVPSSVSQCRFKKWLITKWFGINVWIILISKINLAWILVSYKTILFMEGSLWNKTDLLALYVSGTRLVQDSLTVLLLNNRLYMIPFQMVTILAMITWCTTIWNFWCLVKNLLFECSECPVFK